MIGVEPITETREQAKQKYLEYRKAVMDGGGVPGDEQAMRAYRELAKGRRLIDIGEAFRIAGVNNNGSPKLAIIRADAKLCWGRWYTSGLCFDITREALSRYRSATRIRIPVGSLPIPGGTFTGHDGTQTPRKHWGGRAVVPSIPPSLRPRGLHNYHILWEASWESVPVDPMLLKRMGGTLYAVFAEWDLTPVEQAILRRALVRD